MPIPRDPDRPRWEWSGIPGFVAPLKQGDYANARAYHYYKTYRKSAGIPWSHAMKSVARKLHIAWIEQIILQEAGLVTEEPTVGDRPVGFLEAHNHFRRSKSKSLTKNAIDKINQAMHRHFPEDVPLDAKAIEDRLIASLDTTDLSQSTIRKHLNQINRICRYCIDRGWLETNPVKLVGIPREPPKADVDVWTRTEVEEIVEWMRTKSKSPMREWYALLFEWISWTSMRPGATLLMRRRHIERDVLRIPTTKTGKARALPIGGTAEELAEIGEKFPKRLEWQQTLRRLLDELIALYDEHHAELSTTRGVHWPQHKLWPMRNTDKFRKQFDLCKTELDLRNGRLYDLRATAEDYWVWELGFGMRTVCAYAGHSPSIFYKYYEKRYGSDEHRRLLRT